MAPSGGEKDTDPPKIMVSYPQNEALNFKDNQIRLAFDEYVQLKGATGKLVVSPPLKYPVEMILKGKTVEVIWDDTLDENTTYMFQFGDGIVDFRESNPLDSNVFVFSTGSYLDSMELTGQIINAFDLKPAEGVWVMLYEKNIDSLPKTEQPRYFSKSNKDGIYHIKYLKPGDYKIFALKAENQGYIFDLPEEQIAFDTKLVSSVKPSEVNESDSGGFSGPKLLLFKEKDTIQYISEQLLAENKAIVLRLNLPADTLIIKELSGLDIEGWEADWNLKRDSVAYWLDSTFVGDSIKIKVSDGLAFTDTLMFRKRVERGKKKGNQDAGIKFTMNAKGGKLDFFKNLEFQFSEPITSIKPERWILTLDSDTIDLASKVDFSFRKVTIAHDWKKGAEYRLMIPDSTVLSKYEKSNDTLNVRFTVSDREDYGQLKVDVRFEGISSNLVWQLFAGEKLIDERIIKNEDIVEYAYLKAGKYQVKVIVDKNGNGKWDPGDYDKRQQPEKVIFYEESIEVRNNWIDELIWNYSLE